jgi:YVTN family beta-propeller protein
MKRPQRSVVLITVAIAAIGPAVTTAAAVASVSRGRSTAQVVTAHVRVTATISVGRFPVGVAVNPRTDTTYVANANSGTVSVISGRTNSVTATVRVGRSANGVATNPTTKRIYVTNAASKTVSVINGRTNMVVATVRVGYPAAFGVAANPRTNTSFVTNACSNTVSVLVSCRGRAADSRSTARCRRDDPQAGPRPASSAWPALVIAGPSVVSGPVSRAGTGPRRLSPITWRSG